MIADASAIVIDVAVLVKGELHAQAKIVRRLAGLAAQVGVGHGWRKYRLILL